MPRLIPGDKIVLLLFIFLSRDSSLTLLAVITCFVCVFKVNGNLKLLLHYILSLKGMTSFLGKDANLIFSGSGDKQSF